MFHDVEIWGSGADIGQPTSKTSNGDTHDAHDAHDTHDDNNNKTIDRRRRDDGGDDGGDGDDGSCAQPGRPTYPIEVLGKPFDDADGDAQQRRRRATTASDDDDDDDSRNILQGIASKTRAVAVGLSDRLPTDPRGERGLTRTPLGGFVMA